MPHPSHLENTAGASPLSQTVTVHLAAESLKNTYSLGNLMSHELHLEQHVTFIAEMNDDRCCSVKLHIKAVSVLLTWTQCIPSSQSTSTQPLLCMGSSQHPIQCVFLPSLSLSELDAAQHAGTSDDITAPNLKSCCASKIKPGEPSFFFVSPLKLDRTEII